MKKTVIVLIAVLSVFACSKGYQSQKTSDDTRITLSADRYPLVKGDNTLNLRMGDPSGKPFTDAAVSVRYYMPPMPGMAPMNFTTQAAAAGDHYLLSVNIPMEGGWKVEVTANRPAKAPAMATFNLDAR